MATLVITLEHFQSLMDVTFEDGVRRLGCPDTPSLGLHDGAFPRPRQSSKILHRPIAWQSPENIPECERSISVL